MWRNFRCLHMWRNFRCLHMTDEEKSEMLHIWHVYDVGVVTNFLPQFTRFNVEKNWAQKYICGEKMTNMSSGGHWPWQATLFFWSLSYLGQVLHYCTVTPVRAAVLWKILSSQDQASLLVRWSLAAFWHFESIRSRLADDVKVGLVGVVDVNDDGVVVVFAVIVIIQMDVEKNQLIALSWCRKWLLLLWYTRHYLVTQPDRWSFSFILGPLHWSSISNIPRTQKYSAVEY